MIYTKYDFIKKLRELLLMPDYPSALPIKGLCQLDSYTWDDWHKELKQAMPIRHFIIEDLIPKIHQLKDLLYNDPKYYLRSHLIPSKRFHMLDMRSPQNGYAWGWCDRSSLLLYAPFAILRDFVEKEYPKCCVDWNYCWKIEKSVDDKSDCLDPQCHHNVKKEFLFLYNWWMKERPQREDIKQEEYTFVDKLKNILICAKKKKSNWEEFTQGEEAQEAEDEQMLQRLFKIRQYLWT